MDASIEMVDDQAREEQGQAVRSSREESREDGQDSSSTDQKVKEEFGECANTARDKRIKLMAQHPRCALLPSPEKLDLHTVPTRKSSPGTDNTGTLSDFDRIKDWVTKSELIYVGFYDWAVNDGKKLDCSVFYSFIQAAFSTAFDAIHGTANPELEELVFWYYAGHGLGKESAQELSYSSTPRLHGDATCRPFLVRGCHADANEFVKENRKVKGGELCLHKVGFCDLYGLLKPWIAAVKAKSRNVEGDVRKKNKNLVIILDSCHSGIIAQELKDFEKETNEKDPTFLRENSVTIQAACGPDERTFGGYFTPCFVYLNDPKNTELLNELKAEWMDMTEENRNEYKALELPSPMVVTTRSQSQDVTMELTVQNFNLTLFQDPGFFKFCSIKVYQHQDESLFDGKDRVLVTNSANVFMNHRPFNVLDYKLKTLVNGRYAGTPMGLFLLEDHQNAGYTVCAHIHFQLENTKNHQRINLVHHRKPPGSSVLYLEDHRGLTSDQISQNEHKIQVPLDRNAQDLVKACHDFVESREPGRWNNLSRWNMTGRQPDVNVLFRVRDQLRERSAWEDSYLEYIKEFNLPKVADK